MVYQGRQIELSVACPTLFPSTLLATTEFVPESALSLEFKLGILLSQAKLFESFKVLKLRAHNESDGVNALLFRFIPGRRKPRVTGAGETKF